MNNNNNNNNNNDKSIWDAIYVLIQYHLDQNLVYNKNKNMFVKF